MHSYLLVLFCYIMIVTSTSTHDDGGTTVTVIDTDDLPAEAPDVDLSDWIDQVFNDSSLYPPNPPVTGLNLSDTGLAGSEDDSGCSETNRSACGGIVDKRQEGNDPGRGGVLTIRNGVDSLVWNDGGNNHYNLTMDWGGCNASIKSKTAVGKHTFVNGTTQNDTTMHDIIHDMWSLARVNSTRRNDNTNPFNSHVFDLANALQYEAEQLFDEITCKNTSDGLVVEPHIELRKLLMEWQDYYTGVMLVGLVSGVAGVVLAIIADKGWAPHNITGRNQFQTGLLTFILGIAGGVIMRQAEVGRLDRNRLRTQMSQLGAGINSAAGGASGAVASAMGSAGGVVASGVGTTVRAAADLAPAAKSAIQETAFIAWARAQTDQIRGDRQARRNALANLRHEQEMEPVRVGGVNPEGPWLPDEDDESRGATASGEPLQTAEHVAIAIGDPDECAPSEQAREYWQFINDLLAQGANEAAQAILDAAGPLPEDQAAALRMAGIIQQDQARRSVDGDASGSCPANDGG